MVKALMVKILPKMKIIIQQTKNTNHKHQSQETRRKLYQITIKLLKNLWKRGKSPKNKQKGNKDQFCTNEEI